MVHPDRCSALSTEIKFIAKRIFEGTYEYVCVSLPSRFLIFLVLLSGTVTYVVCVCAICTYMCEFVCVCYLYICTCVCTSVRDDL